MLRDPASGRVVGDSFDIANYLEDTFPDSGGCLFPPDSTRTGLDYESPSKDTPFYAPLTTNQGSKNEAYARFNVHVDATFSAHMMLRPVPPLQPEHGRGRPGPLRQARAPELLGRYLRSGRGERAAQGGVQGGTDVTGPAVHDPRNRTVPRGETGYVCRPDRGRVAEHALRHHARGGVEGLQNVAWWSLCPAARCPAGELFRVQVVK